MSFVRSVQEPDPAFFDHVSFYKGQLFDRPLNYLIDQCSKLCSLFPCLLLVLLMPPINACCVCMALRRSVRIVESGSCWRNFQDSTCCDCRSSSSSSVPTTSIRLDRASFISFFDHEHSRGSRLSLIQRSSIVALHSLGFSIPQVAEFTHCTASTIQHWVDHFAQHGNLICRLGNAFD